MQCSTNRYKQRKPEKQQHRCSPRDRRLVVFRESQAINISEGVVVGEQQCSKEATLQIYYELRGPVVHQNNGIHF